MRAKLRASVLNQSVDDLPRPLGVETPCTPRKDLYRTGTDTGATHRSDHRLTPWGTTYSYYLHARSTYSFRNDLQVTAKGDFLLSRTWAAEKPRIPQPMPTGFVEFVSAISLDIELHNFPPYSNIVLRRQSPQIAPSWQLVRAAKTGFKDMEYIPSRILYRRRGIITGVFSSPYDLCVWSV